MSYLDKVSACNQYDLDEFQPFLIGAERFGWLRPEFAEKLLSYEAVFVPERGGLSLNPALESYQQRTEAVAQVLAGLAGQGVISGWRGESYPVTHAFEQAAEMEIERAAAPYFGLRAFGVHINGLVEIKGQSHVWVARRAADKITFPGMLDHLAAGGQPANLSLMQNVIKECREEADVPENLSSQAKLVGKIEYCVASAEGLKPDTLFAFDLDLPESFEPHNTDGEVDSFELWPIEKVAEVVEHADEFKPNCNLVLIDLLIRKGLIESSHPEYEQLCDDLLG